MNERSTGRQYRCVLSGPNLTADEQTECLTQLRQAANSADFVVASGSLPPGADRDARPGGRHAPGSAGGAGRFLDNGAVFDGDLAYADSRRCADAIAWEAVLSAVLSAPMSAADAATALITRGVRALTDL